MPGTAHSTVPGASTRYSITLQCTVHYRILALGEWGGCRALLEVTGTQSFLAAVLMVHGPMGRTHTSTLTRPFALSKTEGFYSHFCSSTCHFVGCFPCAMHVLIYVITQLAPLGGVARICLSIAQILGGL